MLEADIMLILNANDAVSEAGQLTDELHRRFSYENNTWHWTLLNTAINSACSHARGNESKTKHWLEWICSEVQRAAQLEKGTCVVKYIIIHSCEEADLLRQAKLGPNSRAWF